MPRQKLSASAKEEKKRVGTTTLPSEELGVGETPVSPENVHPAHTSPAKLFGGHTIVSMVRHEGSDFNPALRNKVVLTLSNQTETIASEEDLAAVGIEAPAPLLAE